MNRDSEKRTSGRIEDEAALWAVRLERGLAATEQDEFLEWLAADPQHGSELSQQRSNWARLGVLADWRPEHSPRPNRDLLAPPPKSVLSWADTRRRWLVPVVLGAAAAAIVLLSINRNQTVETPEALAGLTPITAIEQRTLPDGSVVSLNRGAEIAVLFTAGERRVRLERGEAHFTVAKAPVLPFIVSARGVEARAVGTVFNVRIDSAVVDVLVTEGRVQVSPPEPSRTAAPGTPAATAPLLAAGQRARVPLAAAVPEPQVIQVTPAEVEDMLAWQPRFLDFTDAPLASIVAEFNRRNAPVRIAIADTALAELEVSAALRSDNVEGFVHLLEVSFGVRAERSGDSIDLRKAGRR